MVLAFSWREDRLAWRALAERRRARSTAALAQRRRPLDGRARSTSTIAQRRAAQRQCVERSQESNASPTAQKPTARPGRAGGEGPRERSSQGRGTGDGLSL